MAGVPVRFKKQGGNFVLVALTVNQEGVNNRRLATFETLFVCTVHRVGNSPKFISSVSDDVIDDHGLNDSKVVLVKLEPRKLVIEQTRIENRCWKIVEAVKKEDLRPV